MKKINIFLITIFTLFVALSNVSADDSNLNAGSAGTWTPSDGSKSFSSGITSEQTGLRLTVVDENGNKISQNVVDYWSNGVPTNAKMLAGSSFKTNIVNNHTLSFKLINYNGYVQGNQINIGGASSATWEAKHQYIENLIDGIEKGNSCKNPAFLDELGYDLCAALANDCDALEKIYILIEPLNTFHLIEDHNQKFVMSGTEYSFFLKRFANLPDGVNIIRNQIGGNLWRDLVNMRLSCFSDNDDCTWNLKSGSSKYAYLNSSVGENACEGGNCGNLNYHDGTWRDANGNVYGTSMHLVWLGRLAKKCETPKCCVPCDPDDNVCIKNAGENYNPDDPYCCYEESSISDGGVCVPIKDYWKNHDKPGYCKQCVPHPSNNYCCDEPGFCDKEENKEICDKYCSNKCKPSKITANASCDTANCDDSSSNVSTFKDPIFNSESSSLAKVIGNEGDMNIFLTEEELNKIALDDKDNSFMAVAQQGETYKTKINQYCDLYCQEKVIITLPNFYPAANAGRYFQWYVQGEDNSNKYGGPLIKQEVVKICAEDIKFDEFLKEYYNWMISIQSQVDTYTNYNMICEKYPEAVYNFEDAFGGDTSADKYCDFNYNCELRKNIPTCNFMSCNKDNLEQCTAANQKCAAEWEEYRILVTKLERIREECKNGTNSYKNQLQQIHNDFINTNHSFVQSYETFMQCFDSSLGTDISSDLSFELNLSGMGKYYSSKDFTHLVESSNEIAPSSAICVDDNDDCDNNNFYSFNPNLIPNYNNDDKNKMSCRMDNWSSTNLIYKGYEYTCTETSSSQNSSTSNSNNQNSIIGSKSADLNGDGIVSLQEQCELGRNSCKSYFLREQSSGGIRYTCNSAEDGKTLSTGETLRYSPTKCSEINQKCDVEYGFDEACSSLPNDQRASYGNFTCSLTGKSRRNSVPNFVEGREIDYRNFPLTITDFNSLNTSNETNGWTISETASDYNKENINWFKTFRLLIQSKTDSYVLNDTVNACVCNDGTVSNLITADEARKEGLNVSAGADYICNCPVSMSDSYASETKIVNQAFSERTDTWGVCKYSGYTTVSEGGNYSVKYSAGSGKYSLSISYWNIGSLDSDGKSHFSNLDDFCRKNCDGEKCYYAGEYCKLIIGNALMNDSWSKENTNWWDLSASYYVCKAGSCEPPEPTCPSGDCVEPPVCPNGSCNTDGFPTDDCENGKCTTPSGLALIYRSVDLDNPFGDRQAGENWTAGSVDSVISNNRGVSGSALYSSDINPLYSFKLTPDVVKQIRAFNSAYGRDYASSSTIAYPNDMMNATDENGNNVYNKGISQVLNNELLAIFETAAANNNSSLDEWFSVPLLQSCDDWYKLEDSGHSYCEQIGDSFRIISGDQKCWDYVSKYNSGGGK